MSVRFQAGATILALVALGWAADCPGQTTPPAPVPDANRQGPERPRMTAAGDQPPDRQSTGSISGTVVDRSGAVLAGALIRLTREEQSPAQEVLSGLDGRFSFTNVDPGPFHLTITSAGFASQASAGTLHSGETYIVPQITVDVATAITEVEVGLSAAEVAVEEIHDQEKQRVFGFIPNFYVSYEPQPVPLSSKLKFELAWEMTVDPVNFLIVGLIAGVQQAQNAFSGYGQGAQGYGKRYGASFADSTTSTFIGSAILPSLLKQDPRYFYKGTGGKRSRALYAIAATVICKGDNGHWQPNYSNVFGSLAAGGISNLYYPAKDRNGMGLTFENTLIGMGAGAGVNLFQEFLVRKLTPSVRKHDPGKP